LQQTQQHWAEAAQWFIKAVIAFISQNDTHNVGRVVSDYINLLQQSDDHYHEEIRQR